MIALAGQYSLLLGLIFCSLQVIILGLGLKLNHHKFIHYGYYNINGQFICILLAFFLLIVAYIKSDFSLKVVAENSYILQPLIYKIAAAWGNHEGSILLWILVISCFTFIFYHRNQSLDQKSRSWIMIIQGFMNGIFLLFILTTSSPFQLSPLVENKGAGLNPLLQDPGLALHPPMLYIGYVGFSLSFCFAIAGLITGKINHIWASALYPWVLFSWLFLGIGICLGSYWAYYELGWGGWWYWDPVENASLMPWLAATALIHSLRVLEKRNILKKWSAFLAIITFTLSLIGTFLVRSGILISVHSFASDPSRGIFILDIIVLISGSAFLLFAFKAPLLKETIQFTFLSRENSIILNNLLLCTATATVFLGTFYPVFLEFFSTLKVSVGPPYFNKTFGIIIIPLGLIVIIGMEVAWRKDIWKRLWRNIKLLVISISLSLGLLLLISTENLETIFGFGLSLWIIMGSIHHLTQRLKIFILPFHKSLIIAQNLPWRFYGMIIAHAGIGILLLGIVGNATWTQQIDFNLIPKQTVHFADYNFHFDALKKIDGPNYTAYQATIFVYLQSTHEKILELFPEKRLYLPDQTLTSETAIGRYYLTDIYTVLGEPNTQGIWNIKIYIKPFMIIIWSGFIAIIIGGFLCLVSILSNKKKGNMIYV
ncbi:MAG: heme lyase CcmF/NrfE family subunit [Alphaproteobacteria bacterium]|nr:heme lyase CcmF/NrfE family subunit [Alphaproteobacteria bacterium]